MNEVSPFKMKEKTNLRVNYDDFNKNSRQLSIIEESILDDLADDKGQQPMLDPQSKEKAKELLIQNPGILSSI